MSGSIEPIKPSMWFQQQRAKASIRETAKEVFRQLEKWYANKESSREKWAWELIQNARDVAKDGKKGSFEVVFSLEPSQLVFQHNSGPFSLSNIASLINARSDKPMESVDIVGEFGKGFIVTHTLSGKVIVKGQLKDDSVSIHKPFQIHLDRSLKSTAELTVERIASNIEDCERELDSTEVPSIAQGLTQFEYLLDNEGHKMAENGLDALEKVLPFVLVFTEPKMRVKIIRGNQERVYEVKDRKIIETEPIRIERVELGNHGTHQLDNLILATSVNSEVKIAIPLLQNALCELSDTPRLFKMFPLPKTRDLRLPVVIYASFRVSDDRSNIQYRNEHIHELRNILETLAKPFMGLSNWILKNNVGCKEKFFKLEDPPKDTPCRSEWVQALGNLVKEISQQKVVEAVVDLAQGRTDFLEPGSVYFPSPIVGADNFDEEGFLGRIWGLSHYLGLRVPVKGLLKEWNDIRTCWKSLGVTAGKEQTFEDLVEQVHKLKGLTNLKKGTPLNTDENAVEFLKYLYKLGDYYRSKRKQVPVFLRKQIYCNQKGDFKGPHELVIDQDISNDLKEISEDLLESLKEKLLDTKFSKEGKLNQHFQALGMRSMNEGGALDLLYRSICTNWKKRGVTTGMAFQYKKAVLEFEKWLLRQKNFEALEKDYPLKELPFLCEDGLLREVEKEYLLLPILFTEENARKHIEIWPRDVRLSETYSKDITDPTIIADRLVTAGIGKRTLFYAEEITLSRDMIREMSDTQIRGNYEATTEISRVIAFDQILKKAEESRDCEFTNNILDFVLSYLVPRDDSWQGKSIKAKELSKPMAAIPVPTGKESFFSIYPCLWLVQMKNHKWVTSTSVDEKGETTFESERCTKDSLSTYLPKLRPSILENEKVQAFLQKRFNFSLLEITGWLLTGGSGEAEQTLIDSLRHVHKLADSQGIDTSSMMKRWTDTLMEIHELAEAQGISVMDMVDQILTETQRRSRLVQVTRRNRNFGLIMQELAQKVFEELKFKEYGFLVIPRWKACDFEAYLQRKAIEESDYGTLSIEVKKVRDVVTLARFEVEVKATRVGPVTMTLAQAERAADNIQSYLLCVVDSKQFDVDLMEFNSVSLSEEQIKTLSERIIPYMKIVSVGEDLARMVIDFQNASSANPDIEVNYDASFTISEKLWRKKGRTIVEWFSSILHMLGIST